MSSLTSCQLQETRKTLLINLIVMFASIMKVSCHEQKTLSSTWTLLDAVYMLLDTHTKRLWHRNRSKERRKEKWKGHSGVVSACWWTLLALFPTVLPPTMMHSDTDRNSLRGKHPGRGSEGRRCSTLEGTLFSSSAFFFFFFNLTPAMSFPATRTHTHTQRQTAGRRK